MEPLKLSDELVIELQKVLAGHDARAGDAGVAVQYYAAIIGFMLAQQSGSLAEKKEFLNQLNAFSRHVLDDCNPPQAPRGDAAIGQWRPGDA
ncbi:MAG: hypothetical protein L0Z73_13285 [Gammaproteobacteria bacterium]|nr:hypothetical protein [Gammaproteobacteria bacterium]